MMKTQVLSQREIRKLGLDGLEYGPFAGAVRWEGYDSRDLAHYVINPFSDTLKGLTGYNDEIRPAEPETGVVNVDGIEFTVTTTPTGKRTSYQAVVSDFEGFLQADIERYRSERLRSGFLTLTYRKTGKKEQYLPLPMIVKRTNKRLNKSKEGKKGISQRIEVATPELVGDIPDVFYVLFGRDYRQKTRENAEAFARAGNLADRNNEALKEFKSAVAESTVKILGGEPESPAAVSYPFEHGIFIVQLEPRDTVSYSKILIDGFLKGPSKTLTTRSVIGDFELLELVRKGAEQQLRVKGLIDDEFLETYDMQVRDGIPYVRVKGIISRLEFHRARSTKHSVETNISMQPVL